MQNNKKRADEDEILYRLLLIFMGIGFIYLIPSVLFDWNPLYAITGTMPCIVHLLTGGYCPGCGGTRAVRALVAGDIKASIFYHPLVLYVALFVIVFLLTHTLKHLTGGRIKGLRFQRKYIYVGIVLTILNWVVKNYFYFVLGISLMD